MTQELVSSITTPLEAIEAFAATDKVTAELGSSVWEQFARFIAAGLPVAGLAATLKASEDAYKLSHKGGLPASYRSAKSTALGALARRICLLDPDGNPVGKSAIASMCRDHDAKSAAIETESMGDVATPDARLYALARFQRAAARLSKLALSETERTDVRTTCEALINGLVVSS